MINVIASINVKQGRLSEFLKIFKSNVPNVLKEKGCIEYFPAVDTPTGLAPQEMNENVVTILERWDSVEDLKRHLTSPHMIEYFEKTGDIVENMSIKVLQKT